MKSLALTALCVLNTALLCTLVSRVLPANTANAQVRRPGDYLLVPGEVTGGITGVVYVLDQSNQTLGAVAFDEARGVLDSMPPQNLSAVFQIRR